MDKTYQKGGLTVRGYSDEQMVVTQAELARMVKASPSTIRNMIQDGRLHPDRFIVSHGTGAFSMSEAESIIQRWNQLILPG